MEISNSLLPGFGNCCPILEDLGTLTSANCAKCMYVIQHSLSCKVTRYSVKGTDLCNSFEKILELQGLIQTTFLKCTVCISTYVCIILLLNMKQCSECTVFLRAVIHPWTFGVLKLQSCPVLREYEE